MAFATICQLYCDIVWFVDATEAADDIHIYYAYVGTKLYYIMLYRGHLVRVFIGPRRFDSDIIQPTHNPWSDSVAFVKHKSNYYHMYEKYGYILDTTLPWRVQWQFCTLLDRNVRQSLLCVVCLSKGHLDRMLMSIFHSQMGYKN
jgi:hypothetical protein